MEKQLITFNLMEEEYGIDILQVDGIQRLKEITITRVPRAQEFIDGIINLRGDVIPVIDLRKRFELGSSPQDRDTRIIVVNVNEKLMGLLVDRVNEVTSVKEENIDEPPQEITQIDSQFIEGIGKTDERLIILLDIENILTSKEEEEISRLAENE